MQKNHTPTGNDLSEESAICEVFENNVESLQHAPKDLSKLNLRAWLYIENLSRQTKEKKEKQHRLKRMWGRIGDA